MMSDWYLYFWFVIQNHANSIEYYFGFIFSVRAEILNKKGSKVFPKSKKGQKKCPIFKSAEVL
jgi:hypothetical protein